MNIKSFGLHADAGIGTMIGSEEELNKVIHDINSMGILILDPYRVDGISFIPGRDAAFKTAMNVVDRDPDVIPLDFMVGHFNLNRFQSSCTSHGPEYTYNSKSYYAFWIKILNYVVEVNIGETRAVDELRKKFKHFDSFQGGYNHYYNLK